MRKGDLVRVLRDAATWELGSEFAWWPELTDRSMHFLRESEEMQIYATGRSAMAALAQVHRSGSAKPALHVPTYFCTDVVDSLTEHFVVRFYRDDPRDPTPDWSTLAAKPGDIALVSNTFGVRDGVGWAETYDSFSGVVFIEDHTHDPTSDWAEGSHAHYCFASLRKTVPVPDGAILWSPKSCPLPTMPELRTNAGLVKLSAMLMKSAYLAGIPLDKQVYRRLEVAGEEALEKEVIARASDLTVSLLPFLDLESMRNRKLENLNTLLDRVGGNLSHLRPLFSEWPSGACPFNFLVEAESFELRGKLRNYLIRERIYPAIHWRQELASEHGDRIAANLSERVLTIPADFRYSGDDMVRVADLLIEFDSDLAK